MSRTENHHIFPETLISDQNSFAGTREWFDEALIQKLAHASGSVDSFVLLLQDSADSSHVPAYVSELVSMEGHLFKLAQRLISFDPYPETKIINPTLKVFSNTWQDLAGCIGGIQNGCCPVKGEERILIWQPPDIDSPKFRPVTDRDLLILKMTVEDLSPEQVAASSEASIADINSALHQGLESGIILGPRSKIMRTGQASTHKNPAPQDMVDSFKISRGFALQWHITQACDLHCRHCYDRTPCESLSLKQEIAVLDTLYEFCNDHHVFGQVSFTGGNPLLHPHFHRLYREASDRGFVIGILGNPASGDEIESLAAIQQPAFYQMSLEGLEPHNDYIRGPGHFQRVLGFLEILREHEVYSKIMLTLTRDNMDQVIPLGKLLQGIADVYTFNRLSLVGEGANLIMAAPEDFRNFLNDYREAAEKYPVFDLKDNLFNIVLDNNRSALFGGCTGYGCGAAFNFVCVLATGEVHACRKFPSPIGDITRQSLNEIYHSQIAGRYRKGPETCGSCHLNVVCRGCMAALYSHGLDVFSDKDPYCFISGTDGSLKMS